MGVLVAATARVFDEESSPPRNPAKHVKRDSIDVQKHRPANDDEPHDDHPGLDDLLIPRACGSAALPDEAETKAEAKGEVVGDPQGFEREAPEIEEEDDDGTQEAAAEAQDAAEEAEEAPEAAPVSRKARKPRRHIQWGEVHVRDYDMTLGDHPCCSYGPPVGLSWDYTEYGPVDVDDYEFQHPPRRNLREMQLNYYARKHLLDLAGVTEKEWKRRTKEVGRDQRRRHITVQAVNCYPLVQVETAVESARRKFKRLVRSDRRQNLLVAEV